MHCNRIALAMTLTIILVSLHAFGEKTEPAKTVRIAVPFSVSSIPVLDLDDATTGGTKLSVSVFQDHSLAFAEFLRGDADVMMTGFTQGVAAREGNKSIVHLTTVVWGVSSVMVKDESAAGLRDLAGKTIIVPFAKSPLDLQIRSILRNAEILDRVTIEYGPAQQAIPLLIAGKTDAIAVPEPFASDLEAKGNAKRLFTLQDAWATVTGGEGRSPQVSFFAKKDFAESHKAFLRSFFALVAEKIEEVRKAPLPLSVKYADTFHSTPEIVSTGLSHTLFDLPGRASTISICNDYLKRIGLNQPEAEFYFGID